MTTARNQLSGYIWAGVTSYGLTPVAPAPTTVWISSMKRMIFPLESVTSLMTAFSRSSNSPRYLAPAMSEPMSRDIRILSCSEEGTSPEQIRCASPAQMHRAHSASTLEAGAGLSCSSRHLTLILLKAPL